MTSQGGDCSARRIASAPPPSFPVRRRKKVTCRRYAQSSRDFIRAWEASAKLRMPKPILLARASSYRQLGVKLKKMPRKWKKQLDVESLNRLVEELRGPPGGRGAEDDASPERPGPTPNDRGGLPEAGDGGGAPGLAPVVSPRPEVVVSAPTDLLPCDVQGLNSRGEHVPVFHDAEVYPGESALPLALTVKEAALVLRCGLSTVYDMCAKGALGWFKLRPESRKGIRVLTESLVALMARRTTPEPDSPSPAQPKRRPRGSKRLHLPSPF